MNSTGRSLSFDLSIGRPSQEHVVAQSHAKPTRSANALPQSATVAKNFPTRELAPRSPSAGLDRAAVLAGSNQPRKSLSPEGVQLAAVATWKPTSVTPAQYVTVVNPQDLPGVPSVPPVAAIDATPALAMPLDESQQATNSLDFATVLALVSGQNPQVAFAQERINEAFARVAAAHALWLPSIRGGAGYNKHEGNLQDVRGGVVDLSRGSVFTGLGARAVGAGSPTVPGLSAQFHLADAIFQPIIAERTAAARQHRASAVTNDAMLAAAIAYVELARAVQTRAIAYETLQNADQLATQTASFARSGQGAQADADRVQTELTLRQNEVTRADEAVQVASARLAELLSLETTFSLRPAESTVAPIEMVAAGSSLEDLVASAKANRPETSESQFLTSAAHENLKRERSAPFVPNMAVGLSYGGFGAGVGNDISQFRDRMDFDAVAYWEVRNLGLGEQAARAEAHAVVHQSQHRELQVSNQVAREVAESFAQTQSRHKQIAVAERGVASATDSYRRNLERIRQGQGLPIEVLQSLQALDQARREYLRAVSDYNVAQFSLHRALGWPVAE